MNPDDGYFAEIGAKSSVWGLLNPELAKSIHAGGVICAISQTTIDEASQVFASKNEDEWKKMTLQSVNSDVMKRVIEIENFNFEKRRKLDVYAKENLPSVRNRLEVQKHSETMARLCRAEIKPLIAPIARNEGKQAYSDNILLKLIKNLFSLE